MKTSTKICFQSPAHKFECDLAPLLWASPYVSAKHKRQQCALIVKKAKHTPGCISQSAASTQREAILALPMACVRLHLVHQVWQTLTNWSKWRAFRLDRCWITMQTDMALSDLLHLDLLWAGGWTGGSLPAWVILQSHAEICTVTIFLSWGRRAWASISAQHLSLKLRCLPMLSSAPGKCPFLSWCFLMLPQSFSATLSLSKLWELISSSANPQESQHYHLELGFRPLYLCP